MFTEAIEMHQHLAAMACRKLWFCTVFVTGFAEMDHTVQLMY